MRYPGYTLGACLPWFLRFHDNFSPQKIDEFDNVVQKQRRASDERNGTDNNARNFNSRRISYGGRSKTGDDHGHL